MFSFFSEPHSLRISYGALQSVRSPPTYTLWDKDTSFTGGLVANATAPSDITLSLNTLRYFPRSDRPTNCYNLVRVPMGHYTVRIFFGLVNKTEFVKKPLFDISIEGTLVFSLIPGWSEKDDQVFVEAMIFVLNGTSTICFHTGQGDPTILSIELLEVEDEVYNAGHSWDKGTILRTVKRLNCGARTYTLWHKDTLYMGGLAANATSASYITPSLKTLRYFPNSDGPTN